MAGVLTARLTRSLGLAAGAARIYGPGFGATAGREDHPLVRDPASRQLEGVRDQGAFRRLLCRRICEMSAAVH